MNDLERDLRQMFERREADLRKPRFAPAHAPAPLLRRTRRRQVGAVLTTIAVVAAVAIGSAAGAVALLRSSDRLMPADPSETPAPWSGEPVRPDDLDQRFDVATAWGEVDGVGWTVWANDDLSCLAFTSARPGEYSGVDSGCTNGYEGSDLTLTGTCVYACPAPGRPIIYGTVSGRVARVQLVLDDGSTYPGTIHASRPEVTVDARVFTVPIDRRWGTFTGILTAAGADGAVLGEIRYPGNADAAGGWSMPISVEATFASGVPVSEVDGRTSEADRWELSVWRTASGDWCLGTIFPNASRAVVATEGQGCGPREDLFQGIRRGAIGHADVWWIDEASMFGKNARWFRYRAVGTVSSDVASVRIALGDGQVVDAVLYDPPPGLEDMGRLFVAEFRSKDHPWEYGGEGGITWRAVALGANGEVLGSDEVSL